MKKRWVEKKNFKNKIKKIEKKKMGGNERVGGLGSGRYGRRENGGVGGVSGNW